jgi:predicted nucleic acid-binding protein
MIIVDTTVWVDDLGEASNRETDYLDRELGLQRFGLTDLILCEVLQGITDERAFPRFPRVLNALRRFEVYDTGGQELAVSTARNFLRPRPQGRTVRKTIDCLIATFCVVNRCPLLHRDRDFDPFEETFGLSVIHP